MYWRAQYKDKILLLSSSTLYQIPRLSLYLHQLYNVLKDLCCGDLLVTFFFSSAYCVYHLIWFFSNLIKVSHFVLVNWFLDLSIYDLWNLYHLLHSWVLWALPAIKRHEIHSFRILTLKMKQNTRKATTYHLPMQRGVYITWSPLWNQIHMKLQLEGPLTVSSLSYVFRILGLHQLCVLRIFMSWQFWAQDLIKTNKNL